MELRNIGRLGVSAVALSLLFTAQGQSAFAKSEHGKRHHHHGKCAAMSKCPKEKDIFCTLSCDGSFKNLTAALKAAGLAKTLCGKGPFTLFAPDDKAFDKHPKGFVSDLTKDPKRLKAVLTYHVLPRTLSSSELANMRAAKTVEGDDVMLDSKNGVVEVDGALVTKADIKCNNGVIHVIDDVLAPDRGK